VRARLLAEAQAAGLLQAPPAPPAPTPEAAPVAVADPPAAGVPAPELAAVQEALKKLQRESALGRLSEAVNGSGLSDPGKTRIRESFTEVIERRDFTPEEVTAEIERTRVYEAAFAQQWSNPTSLIRQVSMGDNGQDKQVKALMGWFAGEAIDGVKPVGDLKESYARWTGQNYLDIEALDFWRAMGRSFDSGRDHKRVTESLVTSDWDKVFGDVLYQMAIKAYQASPEYNKWRLFVSDFESPSDFRTRHWARVGGYGDLDGVSEQGTYPEVTSPTDEEATYAVTKRGGIESVTMEMVLGDRLAQVRRIPQSLGYAAARTLYKYIMNLITTDNPTLTYDSVALYDAAHGNTGTTALSVGGLDVTQIAMRDQTAYNQSSEIIGARNKIKHLIVPNELEARALRVTNPSDNYGIAMATADTSQNDLNIDPHRFKGQGIQVTVYDQMTDATDYFCVADPAQVATMVVGFLGGNQEPEIFVQDNPNLGSGFDADKIQWKVRHIYSAAILEHRSFYRQVVG